MFSSVRSLFKVMLARLLKLLNLLFHRPKMHPTHPYSIQDTSMGIGCRGFS